MSAVRKAADAQKGHDGIGLERRCWNTVRPSNAIGVAIQDPSEFLGTGSKANDIARDGDR